uniref:Uncharacterized protein n=1 Tax=Larimichthys crocea TaxID=215358 RepID=A0A0F8AI16_LARCR
MTEGEVEPDTKENMEMEDTEDIVEQAREVTIQGDESDTVEDLKVDNMEDNVEKCLPETTDEQIEHTGMEEVDVETGQVSKGVEKHVTAMGTNLPPTPSVPRRSSQRNQRPPKKLSYELRAVESEEDRQKVAPFALRILILRCLLTTQSSLNARKTSSGWLFSFGRLKLCLATGTEMVEGWKMADLPLLHSSRFFHWILWCSGNNNFFFLLSMLLLSLPLMFTLIFLLNVFASLMLLVIFFLVLILLLIFLLSFVLLIVWLVVIMFLVVLLFFFLILLRMTIFLFLLSFIVLFLVVMLVLIFFLVLILLLNLLLSFILLLIFWLVEIIEMMAGLFEESAKDSLSSSNLGDRDVPFTPVLGSSGRRRREDSDEEEEPAAKVPHWSDDSDSD